MRRSVTIGLLALVGSGSAAFADIVEVQATAAIFDAGRAAPSLDGSLPPSLAIPANADYFYLDSVEGLVRAHPVLQWAGPDGNSTTLNDTDINSYMGISGLIHPRTLPLVAVFLGADEPENPAPSRLDFYQLGSDFASLAPQLGQSFFIGDGWTGGMLNQQFVIPAGATRVFFGLPDAPYFTGDPGAYHDNTGSFVADVQFHLVPGAGSLALMGIAGLLTIGRRR